MKEKTWINSCGTKHNFYRESKSRKKWENKLFINEGIKNVFQREEVKKKIKSTILEKYGVDQISKSPIIKEKKLKTLRTTINKSPNLFKENWHKIHQYFLIKLGYDPRLHSIGRSSKESLKIFSPLMEWCISRGIDYNDIYLGIDGKKEYFISTDKKIYFYDFTIESKKIIIEFHGSTFHANPENKNLNDWKNPFTGEDSKSNIERTRIKNNKATIKGFKVLEIWDSEDADINLNICKNFIIKNYEDKINKA